MKQYFTPMFLTASGNIDITASQAGTPGTGEVYDDIWGVLNEWGITADQIAGVGISTNPEDWIQFDSNFNPNDSTTWDIVLDHIVNAVFPS